MTDNQKLGYTAYGFLPGMTRNGKLAFNGQLLAVGGQGYLLGNGHRLYNPVLMRFNSPDSLSPFGRGGINAYTYCGGDPINFSDPSGKNRFAKLGDLYKRLFNYMESPDRRDYRIQGFSYDTVGGKKKEITTFSAKGDQGQVYEKTGIGLNLTGKFYVDKDWTLFISEGLVLADGAPARQGQPLTLTPFKSQFEAKGFKLMDIDQDRDFPDAVVLTPNPAMNAPSHSGMRQTSAGNLGVLDLTDAIRKGRQKMNRV